jgi:type II secretory ATPase GspE/PulE/Tfp pilus assembly ATPase PilB-like protein
MTAPFGASAERLIGKTVHAPSQCPACLEGYRGRVGIFELLLVDEGMQGLIRDGISSPQAMRAANAGGQPTLLDDALDKVLSGATSLAEVAFALGGSGAAGR